MVASPAWGGVIVAAGRSLRFGDSDKTLTELAGRSVLAHSISAMLTDPRLKVVVVVASTGNIEDCRKLIEGEFYEVTMLSCLGGATRSESVLAGLTELPSAIDYVAIHDAARPLVPTATIRAVLDAAEEFGAAVPVIPVASTLLVEDERGTIAGSLARERVREAQTPQAGRRVQIESALRAYPRETDESTALFRFGVEVSIVPGDRRNIKITTPEDLMLANALLAITGGST